MKKISHLKEIIINLFQKNLLRTIKITVNKNQEFNMTHGYILCKYDQKLIRKILKISNIDISEIQSYMDRYYLGSYKSKIDFAKKYARSYTISSDINEFIDYKKLAKYLLNKEMFFYIKTNGRIHVFTT